MKRFFVMGKQIMLAAVLFAGLTMTACEDENVKPEPPAQNHTTPDPTPENPTPEDPANPTPDNPVTPDKPSTPETPVVADVDLTADMFMQNGETVTCDFVLNEATTTAFGLGTPEKDKYADLTNYKTLVLEATADDSPRLFFNEADPERITVNSESKFWSVADDGKIVIDLAAMAAEYTYVHLNSIKASAYNTQVTILSMKLTGGAVTPAPSEPEKPAEPTPSEPEQPSTDNPNVLTQADAILNYNQKEFGWKVPASETPFTKVTIVLKANEGETIDNTKFGMVWKGNDNPNWEGDSMPDQQGKIEYNAATSTVVFTPNASETYTFSSFRFYPNGADLNFTAVSVVFE